MRSPGEAPRSGAKPGDRADGAQRPSLVVRSVAQRRVSNHAGPGIRATSRFETPALRAGSSG